LDDGELLEAVKNAWDERQMMSRYSTINFHLDGFAMNLPLLAPHEIPAMALHLPEYLHSAQVDSEFTGGMNPANWAGTEPQQQGWFK
jgi:hypothetical protein